jgi:hypothetical protein
MPYKDSQRKKEWERRHRPERLARRRELRRIDVAREATEPTSPQPASGADFPWHLLAGGGVLALYNPAFVNQVLTNCFVLENAEAMHFKSINTGQFLGAMLLIGLGSDQGPSGGRPI